MELTDTGKDIKLSEKATMFSFPKNVSPDEERNGPHTKMIAVYG
jgi:hypothetical protein